MLAVKGSLLLAFEGCKSFAQNAEIPPYELRSKDTIKGAQIVNGLKWKYILEPML